MKIIEAREPPSMAETETYWKSLWGEEAQRNERAEWIRREQERKVSYGLDAYTDYRNYFIFV